MYIELIIIFNVYIDFIVILMTSILLKQKLKLKKILIYSSILGLSSIILFFKISILELIIISFLLSLIIIKKLFGKIKALFYFYFNSIMIGGIIFLINNYFNLNKYNLILLIIISPIIYIVYKFKVKDLKENYNLNYEIEFKIKNQKYHLKSFLDTGNNLIDPYFHKPVILINNFGLENDKYFYIPYSTISESGIMKAFLIDNLNIIGVKKVNNVVVGILPQKLKLKKIDCLLNNRILEE